MNIDKIMNNVKDKHQLIHSITNYVSVNDCANIILASGASPIMADEALEMDDITNISHGLNINIGMLNQNKEKSIYLACYKANNLHHPILLDPVGVGASSYRQHFVSSLLKSIHFDVIRGNLSEIKSLVENSLTYGVDTIETITQDNLDEVIEFIKIVAKQFHCIIAISSVIDVISNGNHTYVIYNGHPYMSKITGSGCMLSALTTTYITANKNNLLEACALSFLIMAIAGEKAYDKMIDNKVGTSSYRNYLIDYVSLLTSDDIRKEANYEIR